MTPEQAKAKELVDKFKPLCAIDISGNPSRMPNAKQCAIICIDEILSIINQVLDAFGSESDGYYEKVKEEIIKLK